MARKTKRVFQKQRLFTPRVVKRYSQSTGLLKNQSAALLSGSGAGASSSSFRYDPAGTGLKSSQQIPVNYNNFVNHTFFSSAESNVNIAFEKVINGFPFDGSRREYEDWLDTLSGYERFVLDRWPTYTGYLTLTSSQYISVTDRAGTLFPSLSRVKTGITILDPKNESFSVESWVGIPAEGNNNQFVFYHASGSVGYAAYIKQTASLTTAPLVFTVFSGSQHVSASYDLTKGKFTELNFLWTNTPDQKNVRIISGSTTVAKSTRYSFRNITTNGAPLVIGSGSALNNGLLKFTPAQTFSGSVKRFSVFSGARTLEGIDKEAHRTLFAHPGLKLSFRFNEATGSYTNNSVVLDHSGMSLHSNITNWDTRIRSNLPYANPINYEKVVFHPTLFPSNTDLLALNTLLLGSASQYDMNNPNLITKLIPEHYLSVAAQLGSISDNPDGSLLDGVKTVGAAYSAPGGARFGQPQIISSLLFMWAREFDMLKMMLDQVSELIFVDYEEEGYVADTFLPFLAEYYGFSLPNLFTNADEEQLFSGVNVLGTAPTSQGLLKVQSMIWRRILKNVREIISSKGTVHSIKTVFRASGIDPDRMFRFIEYGGVNRARLGLSRQPITEISTMLDFSGSNAAGTGTLNPQGRHSTMPALVGNFLTASRIEVGKPYIAGTFVDKTIYTPHGISNDPNDGLLTSGSWTWEGRYRWPVVLQSGRPQSLFRLHATSSDYAKHGNQEALIVNLVAEKINSVTNTGNLTLYCRAGMGAGAPLLTLPLTGANIFDGDRYYIQCGRTESREAGSYISSSYFIKLAKQEFGQLLKYQTTSSYFAESSTAGNNIFQKKSDGVSTVNASGSFVVIGSQSMGTTSSLNFLNNKTAVTSDEARYTYFDGLFGHGRFWSKALTTSETKEHAVNFLSLGVVDPLKNFGFTPDVTGSFEKLRLDISTDQPITMSSATGGLDITDFSQNFTPGATLSGFDPLKRAMKPERYDFSIISPRYDQPSDANKVRVQGFTQGKNLFEIGGLPAPIYEIPKSAEPVDDSRFAIEFSVMQALDEDIMKIFATLNSLDNIIGAPEMMFAEEYPGLSDLREVYFNRLTGAVNYKQFFDLFRWLDNAFNDVIEDLIPRKTNYLGFNFIIEPHALERGKIVYGSGDVYLGESTRRNLKGQLLLRQLVGDIRKF